MRDGLVSRMERRQRLSDEAALAILGDAGMYGWTAADVARRHDVTRQHIYQWRREMRRTADGMVAALDDLSCGQVADRAVHALPLSTRAERPC